MNHRKAYSMIEVMVAMGLSSVLLAVAMGLVHRAMTAHDTAELREVLHREALRFARQIRADVHRATEVQILGNQIILNNNTPADDATITYTLSDEFIRRQATSKAELPHRETFRFPGCPKPAARLLTNPSRLAVTVSTSIGDASPAPPAVLHVQAVVGSRQGLVASSASADGEQP